MLKFEVEYLLISIHILNSIFKKTIPKDILSLNNELANINFALIISSILHYSIQRFIYFKKFDDFNHRSSHKTLATRTGGIGVYLTLLIICIFYYLKKIEIFDYSLFIPISIMFIIGVYDDFYNLILNLNSFYRLL